MNVITHTFIGLKCLTETKIQILYDHVDHTRFHIVEMGCRHLVQLLSAYIVGPTMFLNLTPASGVQLVILETQNNPAERSQLENEAELKQEYPRLVKF